MYIEREIEATIDAKLKQGKVILVTGARQVGKTTTLKHHLGDSFNYVSLENPRDYLLAKEDAMLFFESKELPLIIGEAQRVPELQDLAIDWDSFYSDYVAAYLERDVRDSTNVRDEAKFYSFMVACAARTGQLLNTTDIGNVIDVDHKTVKAWVSVLQASNIIRLLEPFWPNVDKRLTKTPKLFFMDTGLACYPTRWTTPDQLQNGAAAGHIFETFVISEVLKSYMNVGGNLRDVWFYRDRKKREIDLVIQEGRTLHPVEVKISATVAKDAVKNFSCLEGLSDYEVGFGHVICQTPEPYFVSKGVQAVPVWTI